MFVYFCVLTSIYTSVCVRVSQYTWIYNWMSHLFCQLLTDLLELIGKSTFAKFPSHSIFFVSIDCSPLKWRRHLARQKCSMLASKNKRMSQIWFTTCIAWAFILPPLLLFTGLCFCLGRKECSSLMSASVWKILLQMDFQQMSASQNLYNESNLLIKIKCFPFSFSFFLPLWLFPNSLTLRDRGKNEHFVNVS